MGKKIISYSLYNGRRKDVVNGIINCFLAEKIYPGWICRFYIDNTLPPSIKQALLTFQHVELVEMPTHKGSEAMLWRFHPASEDDVDIMISRDGDSWLSYRELSCVNQFIESDKKFHIIRDHCYHSQKIMGGVWGAKKGAFPQMKSMSDEFSRNNTYDQGFLAEYVYPQIVSNSMIHIGDQYDNKGQKTNGYFDDGGIPIPSYIEIPLENFSFEEVNGLNGFRCAHCGKIHDVFIGGIMENIPQRSIDFLNRYFVEHGIDTSILK
jgi:hypothetical protein